MKLLKLRQYLPIVLLGIVLFIIGLIADKSVSETLYANSVLKDFGVIFSNFTLFLFFFPCLTACVTGFLVLVKKECSYPKALRIVFSIIFAGGCAFFIYESIHQIKEMGVSIGNTLGLVIAIITTIVTLGLAILVGYKLAKKYDEKDLFKYVISFLLIVGFSNVMMVIFKYTWSRPRPWYVFGSWTVEAHIDEFRNVYEIHPFEAFKSKVAKEFFKSFPSNHTNNSVMILPAILLYSKLNKKLDNDKARLIIVGASFIFTLLVALTRILAGAHFLSDVSFGLIFGYSVTFFGFIIVNKVFIKYHWIEEE